MAELTESDLISKISAIDTSIAAITTELASGGSGGAANLDYSIGSKRIDGTGRLKQLQEARKVYQDLLEKIPKTIITDQPYKINPLTGEDGTDYQGDQ